MDAFVKANDMLKSKGYTMAYLTQFGSMLYGTNTPKSDMDYKGLYWPKIEDLVVQRKVESITYSTGDNTSRNTSEDIDIQFWSIQYWLYLLRKGDTNAVDLLFSMYSVNNGGISSEEEIRNILGEFYESPIKLIDPKNSVAYLGYAYTQAKKYSYKGIKLEIVTNIYNYLKSLNTEETTENKVGMYFDELVEKFYDPSNCFEHETNNERCVWILGKGLMASVKLYEAVDRLGKMIKAYGVRSEAAMVNKGIDWKSISHAVRCLYQMLEMLETGFLRFPLKDAKEIIAIKEGSKDYAGYVEPLIIRLLDEVKEKIAAYPENTEMEKNHEKILLTHYFG